MEMEKRYILNGVDLVFLLISKLIKNIMNHLIKEFMRSMEIIQFTGVMLCFI
jgi:hypothetical protein